MVQFQDAVPLVLFAFAILIFYRWILRDMERDQQSENADHDSSATAFDEGLIWRPPPIVSPSTDELGLIDVEIGGDGGSGETPRLRTPVATCVCVHCSLARLYWLSSRGVPPGFNPKLNCESIPVKRRA